MSANDLEQPKPSLTPCQQQWLEHLQDGNGFDQSRTDVGARTVAGEHFGG